MKKFGVFLAIATAFVLGGCNDVDAPQNPTDVGLRDDYSYYAQYVNDYGHVEYDEVTSLRFYEGGRFSAYTYPNYSGHDYGTLPFAYEEIRGSYKMIGLYDFILTWDTADGRGDSMKGQIVDTNTIELVDNDGNTYLFH